MKLRQRYVPDLQEMAALCEANYARLLRLLPHEQNRRCFSLEHGLFSANIHLHVEEDHRYTTMLIISQDGYGPTYLQPQSMNVRMYHDARMAEVLSYQHQQRFDGRYRYPNPEMRAPDEKVQLNRFLAEWLDHCLRFGRSSQLISLPNVN